MKYPHLSRLLLGLVQAFIAFYIIQHFTFLNVVGYTIIIAALEGIKEKKFPRKTTK